MTDSLADAQALSLLTTPPVPPATIRWWAHQGHLTRRGQDNRRRTLYSIDQYLDVARERGRSDTT